MQTICKTNRNVTVKSNAFLIIGITVFSLIMSVRNLINFDSVVLNIPLPNSNETFTGHLCTTVPHYDYDIAVDIFYGVDFVCVMIILCTIMTTYTHILCKLFRLRQALAFKSNNKNVDVQNVHCMSCFCFVFCPILCHKNIIASCVDIAGKARAQCRKATCVAYSLFTYYF